MKLSAMNSSELPPLIPTSHRRLRHLKAIHCRNIKTQTPVLPHPAFTLHSVNEQDGTLEQQFYTSEVIKNSLNPNWRRLDHLDVPQSKKSVSVMKIRVLDHSPHLRSPLLLFEVKIDLKELEFLGVDLKKKISHPPNTILIELADGFYRPQSSTSTPYPPTPSPSVFAKTSSTTFSIAEFIQLVKLHRRLKSTQDNTQQLINEINDRLTADQQYAKKLQRRDMTRMRTNTLKQEIEIQTKLLLADKEKVQTKRAELLPRIRKISKAEISLLATKKMLQDDTIKFQADKKFLERVRKQVIRRSWKLIAQLRTIYPVTQTPDGKALAILGFPLPNSDFTSCDEEQIATALGFVCHVLFMAAKYLNVPLRYPMTPMCSRSIIRDDLSQVYPKFPLYSRGVERTRFEYSVFLLNKNLEQLLNSQGLDVVSLRHTLPNLQILLSHNGEPIQRDLRNEHS